MRATLLDRLEKRRNQGRHKRVLQVQKAYLLVSALEDRERSRLAPTRRTSLKAPHQTFGVAFRHLVRGSERGENHILFKRQWADSQNRPGPPDRGNRNHLVDVEQLARRLHRGCRTRLVVLNK